MRTAVMMMLSLTASVLSAPMTVTAAPSEWTVYQYRYTGRVTAICVDGDDVWYGAEKKVYHYSGEDGSTTVCGSMEDHGAGNIHTIEVDGDGVIWIGTTYGVSRFDGTGFRTYISELSNPNVRSMAMDSEDVIWAVGYNALMRFDGAEWATYGPAEGLPHAGVTAVTTDRDGAVWIGTDGHGFIRYDGTSWDEFTEVEGDDDGFAFMRIHEMCVGSDGVIHAIDDDHVYHFDGSAWRRDDVATGTDRLQVMSPMRYGRLIIGSRNGVTIYDDGETRFFDETSGLDHADIRALAVREDNAVYIGMELGISLYDGEEFSTFLSDFSGEVPKHSYINCIAVDHDDNVWFGHKYKYYEPSGKYSSYGISMFDGQTWHQPFKHWFTGDPGEKGRFIFIDTDNNVWNTLYDKVFKYDGTDVTVIDPGVSEKYSGLIATMT